MDGLFLAGFIAIAFTLFAFIAYTLYAGRTRGITPQRARHIMKENFFDLDDAYKHLGIHIAREWHRTLRRVPFSEEVLESCKSTHMLVAIPQISILHMRERVTAHYFHEDRDPWYTFHPFAHEKGMAGWKLIRKSPIPNSALHTSTEQKRLLRPYEYVPTARELVYVILCRYAKYGTRILECYFARTCTKDAANRRVCVGNLGNEGISIANQFYDEEKYTVVGLASAREPSIA